MSGFAKLQRVIATTLKVPLERVTESSTKAALPQWDSLAHLNVMMALEQTFDLTLEVEDFDRLTSVPLIIEFLKQKGVYE